MGKTYLTLQEVEGKPTVVEVQGIACNVGGVKCFWHKIEPRYYICEKETGLAFNEDCYSLATAKNEANRMFEKYGIGEAMERAKRTYPEIPFPLNE